MVHGRGLTCTSHSSCQLIILLCCRAQAHAHAYLFETISRHKIYVSPELFGICNLVEHCSHCAQLFSQPFTSCQHVEWFTRIWEVLLGIMYNKDYSSSLGVLAWCWLNATKVVITITFQTVNCRAELMNKFRVDMILSGRQSILPMSWTGKYLGETQKQWYIME